MNKRLLTILLLAFIIAGACAFLVYRIMGNRIIASRPTPTTRVLAAAQDIKLGTVLAANDLTTIEVSGTPPKGTFLEKDKTTVIGRGVASDLYQGEPILDNRLAPAGSGGGLAATIPKGMRACAVKVDEVVGVAGFVTPGQRVDVLASGNPPNSNQTAQMQAEGTQVRTLLQNIQVLSAGINIQKDAEGKPQNVQVVNLLVTPDQAELLSLASSNNGVKIQLVLRNPLDTKTDPIQGSAMLNIFDQNAGPVKSSTNQPVSRVRRKPKPKPFSVVVINGSKQTVEKFPPLEDNKQ
jgi:pilus assembly protein CpaB